MDSQLENTVINTTEEVLPIVAAASGNPDVFLGITAFSDNRFILNICKIMIDL